MNGILTKQNLLSYKTEILSGLTVALALVPESVAFAFVADIPPIVGLYGAFMMAFITSVFGGRPGMISGATGAMAVVMVHLVKEANETMGEGMGLQYLFVTLILTGMLQICFGVFKLGKYIRMVPQSVMIGFVNGLAIVIGMSQLTMFKIGGNWLQGQALYLMLGLVLLTMGIMYIIPKISKAIPSALLAVIVVSGITIVCNIETDTVLSFVQSKSPETMTLAASLPTFSIPNVLFTWDTLVLIFPYALILATIGLIESLMTLTLVDDLTDTKGSGNRESIAQGVGNFFNGLFGGMGGCAMIGQSMINIHSGGRKRLSGITASVVLLGFIVFGAVLIEAIPIAALTGIMFMVVISTFAWSTFKMINKIPKSDIFVVVLVTVMTVLFDLAIAVISGIIVSALVFAWQNAVRIRAKKYVKNDCKYYEIYGPLFFGSVELFLTKFDVEDDPKDVVINFAESRILDHSAIEAINKITAKYTKLNKKLCIKHLSPDCVKLIKRADKICDINLIEDPDYTVAID